MNPYTFSAICDICGGKGAADIRTAAAAWDTRNTISHTDPQVCRDELAKQREKLERRLSEAIEIGAEAIERAVGK